MLLEEVNQLLKPGYLPMETGYCRLPNGQMYVAALTRMEGCKGKWVDWWFKSHFVNTETPKAQHPKTHLSDHHDVKREPEQYIGIRNHLKFLFFERLNKSCFVIDDPAKFFNTSLFSKARVSAAICGEIVLPDKTPGERVIYLVRDTDDGCEMRSRFWIYNGTEEIAAKRMEHCLADMNVLADFLKIHIEQSQKTVNKSNVMCKFCHSSELIKNGVRKNTQYWRCKNCGHSFVNNLALPRMKYPFDVITSAVNDHHDGKPLNDIRRNIEREFGILPSYSTLYRWEKRLTELAENETK